MFLALIGWITGLTPLHVMNLMKTNNQYTWSVLFCHILLQLKVRIKNHDQTNTWGILNIIKTNNQSTWSVLFCHKLFQLKVRTGSHDQTNTLDVLNLIKQIIGIPRMLCFVIDCCNYRKDWKSWSNEHFRGLELNKNK